MRRILIACVSALGASALAMPAAHAGSPDRVHGGCGYEATNVVGDTQVGVIYDASTTTTGDAVPRPIGATVTCWLTVNGVEAAGTRHTYGDLADARGVQAGAELISFTAGVSDIVEECEAVAFADSTSESWCLVSDGPQFPPQAVWDLVDGVEGPGHDAVCGGGSGGVCATVCAFTRQLAGRYGPVVFADDGDVEVANPFDVGTILVFDCPPYQGS